MRIALWAALLFLPFKGLKAAAVLFLIIAAGIPVFRFLRKGTSPFKYLYTVVSVFRPYVLPVFFMLALAVPFLVSNYYVDVLIMSGIYILLALGLNVIVGYAGLLNLGFAAFYAIGAYTYGLLNTKLGVGFWPALPISAACSACTGLLVAVPALRLRGDYLAIVTLGFGEILRLVLNNWDSVTKGPNGISGIAPPFLFGLPLSNLRYFYYLVLVIVLLSVFIIRRVERSRIGRAWIALRENEIAAASMGINTTRYKLYAFAFGTFWAGIAGVLFAAKMRFISPESFTFGESVLILSMVILGGIGNIYGAILGAFILVLLPEILRDVQLYRMLMLGIGLVLLMIFKPEGLLGKSLRKSGNVLHVED